MLNHIIINSNKRLLTALLLLLAPFSALNAAIVDVSSLTVNTVEASLLATDNNTGFPVIDTGITTPLIPPAVIQMGSFQSSIFDFSTAFTGGTLTGTVYSAGSPGIFEPSASVDTTGGFTSIDLSSLRMSGEITLNTLSAGTTFDFDTELWPITTTPSFSSYDSASGDFTLSWAINEMVDFDDGINMLSLSTIADFTIKGQATVVPLPAAIWLFITGLVALTGFTKLKR